MLPVSYTLPLAGLSSPATTEEYYDNVQKKDHSQTPTHGKSHYQINRYPLDLLLGGFHHNGRGRIKGYALLCVPDLCQADLAVRVHLLIGTGNFDVGPIVHPQLDQVLEFCGGLAIGVEEVGLVDGFLLVLAAEKARVCDVLQRVRAAAARQQSLHDGRGNIS